MGIKPIRDRVPDVRRPGIRARRLLMFCAASLALLACHPRLDLVKPRLEEDGEVFLYLQSMTQEADRLSFRLDGVSALRADGLAVPLTLHLKEIVGKELKRDRLLASGNLPPGPYEGFRFQVSGAALQGEEGVVALPLADEKPMTPVSFTIARKKAQVVSLAFRYRDSLPGGIRFAPLFAAEIPGKLATGLTALVTGRGSNTVTVFDKVTGKVAAVIPTGTSPAGMALDQPLRRAYVAISGDDAVETIDLLGTEVINRGPLTVGDRPEELALTPDRNTLLTANSGSSTVSVLDAASLVEKKRVRVGNGPQSILIDRLGRRAYVFNTLSNSVSVLDLAALEVLATISTEAGPVRGEFNRAGDRLYVLHRYSPYLNVYDAANLSIVRRVYVGTGGSALKVDSRTDLIYLARRGTGEVAIYDPFAFLPIDVYRTREDASFLTIDGEGNNLCLVFPGSNDVRMIHLIGKGTAFETEGGDDPFWVTMMGER